MRRRPLNPIRRFEALEDRRMMAGISFSNGVLTIDGSSDDDVAEVRFQGSRVYVEAEFEDGDDDEDYDRNISGITKIVFNGKAGNDELSVIVNQLNSGVTLNNITLEFHGGENDDQLLGSMHNGVKTVAFGDGGNDILKGSAFGDTLEGGTGDDELSGGGGDDTYVFAGSSNLGVDIITNEAANVNTDTVDLTNYAGDTLVTLPTVYSTASPRYGVYGSNGNLKVKLDNATALENVLGSSNYSNDLRGNSRPNTLKGGNVADILEGAGGNDRLEGGAGDDTYNFEGGNLGTDTVIEAAGADKDLLNFRMFASGINIDLSRSFGAYGGVYAMDSPNLKLILSNPSAIEDVFGSTFDDTITGNGRDNVLHGFNGKDTITGSGGADELWGDVGDDRLFSDAYDLVYGGPGIDWFDRYQESATTTNPRPGRYRDWGSVQQSQDQM
jgi:Ca2+-binding RTX toxin-like protein